MDRRIHQPRGVALMIVLIVVAAVTVLSFAMASSQGVITQAADNGTRAAQADALAESGLSLAMYYLLNPSQAPLLDGNGVYPGQTGVSLGSNLGTVDIAVTSIGNGVYDIACTGNTNGVQSARSVSGRAVVTYGYIPTEASSVNGNFSVTSNMRIAGAVRSSGTVTVALGGQVNGTIYAPSVVGSLLGVVNTVITNAGTVSPAPTVISDYRTYTYDGKTYSAVRIGSTVSGSLGKTVSNPLGVYYADGDVTVNAPLNVTGTLYLPAGSLTLRANTTINAATGMPALIVKNNIVCNGSNRQLTAQGLTWIGGRLTRFGISNGNNLTFHGAVQFNSGNPVDPLLNATIHINYDQTKAMVANLTPDDTAAYSIKLTSFSTGKAD